MGRVIYLVDGFNLYHSVLDAGKITWGASTKWLDLRRLCESLLSSFGQSLGTHMVLEGIYYFSAKPTHRSADKQQRHDLYMRCLRDTGVIVELARFKAKEVRLPDGCFSAPLWPFVSIKGKCILYEEKETDVALAAKLFEVCQNDQCETVVLMTGDTDLAPAVKTCSALFPEKKFLFAFPYKRKNKELHKIAKGSICIKPSRYQRHQFPDPLVLTDGTRISKPEEW